MKFKYVSTLLASTTLLTIGIINNGSTVKASTLDSSQVETNANNAIASIPDYTVPAQFKELDKYIDVENNQYIFRFPRNLNINEKSVQNAQEQLNIANKIVRKQNLVIDPQTKFADPVSFDTNSPFLVLAKRPANENRTYPWGVRSIFRSNAAVRTRVNIYNNVYIGAMAVGDVSGTASMSGFPWAGLVGVVGSSIVEDRCGTWANRLSSYNRSHRKSKIYQDINWAAQDSEGVWHD